MTIDTRQRLTVIVIADDAPANAWLIRALELRHELAPFYARTGPPRAALVQV